MGLILRCLLRYAIPSSDARQGAKPECCYPSDQTPKLPCAAWAAACPGGPRGPTAGLALCPPLAPCLQDPVSVAAGP